MKILILRMWPDELNIKNYNCQEIGLAKALIKKGNICDIVLYSKEYKEDEEIEIDENNKIHIYYLKGKSFLKNLFFEKRLYEIIDNYDIVQTSEYDQIANVFLRKKLKNKLIIYHGPYESEYTKGYKIKCLVSDLIHMVYKDYKKTFVIAKSSLAENFLKKKGFEKVKTIGVGLDIERFQNTRKTNNEINELIEEKNNNNLKYLLYIGKIEERRNIIFLIDILKKINKEREDLRLILVGNGEKEYIDKCKEHSAKNFVREKIHYIESLTQEELTNLYKICEIFVLPTNYDIFGMVLLEAMYFGSVVITTPNGGSKTLIKHDENGYIFKLNQFDQWINIIKELIDNDQKRIEIGNNASKNIRENFLWDNLAEKFLEVYREGENNE